MFKGHSQNDFFLPFDSTYKSPKLSFIPKYILKVFIETFVHIIRLIFIDHTLYRLFVDFNYNKFLKDILKMSLSPLQQHLHWNVL